MNSIRNPYIWIEQAYEIGDSTEKTLLFVKEFIENEEANLEILDTKTYDLINHFISKL